MYVPLSCFPITEIALKENLPALFAVAETGSAFFLLPDAEVPNIKPPDDNAFVAGAKAYVVAPKFME